MPVLSDFTAELVCLGVDAIVLALVYKGYSSVRRAAIDVKVTRFVRTNRDMYYNVIVLLKSKLSKLV
jgi:hypothetical protein